MTPLLPLLLTVACATPPASSPAAASPPPTSPPPASASETRRVVAVGDLHGDLTALRAALRLGGLVDTGDHWTGGTTVLVQLGDVLDRGDDEQEILALFERLGAEARAAGGAVHPLLGNHELMNVAGDLRYVTPGGFADWADVPHDPADPSLAEIPEAARGRVVAFRPGGPVALALADQPVTLVLDGTVFVHGGVLPDHARYGLDRFDAEARTWLEGHGAQPTWAVHPAGPLWTRAYSQDPPDCPALTEALAALGAERMVVAHTPQPGGITSACDDRVWRIDVGMARAYGGRPQVLELKGDTVRVIGP